MQVQTNLSILRSSDFRKLWFQCIVPNLDNGYMLVTIWYSRGHCRSSWLNSLPPYLASFFSWFLTLSVVLLKQLAAVLGFTFFMDHLVSSVGIGSNKQSDFSSFILWSFWWHGSPIYMVSPFHRSLLCRSSWLNSLPPYLASPFCLWIFILSVVLLKQLAAVPGLTFCMDPCTTDSLKRGIQHDEPVRVALMVGSERMMLSVVSNETDRQSVWDPALGLDC